MRIQNKNRMLFCFLLLLCTQITYAQDNTFPQHEESKTYCKSTAVRLFSPLSEQAETIYPLTQYRADTFILDSPEKVTLPITYLHSNSDLISDFLFTISFLIVFAFIRLRGKDLFSNLWNILVKRKKVEIVLNEGISSNLIFYVLSLCLSFSILAIFITSLSSHRVISIWTLYIFAGLLSYHFFLLMLIRLLGWTFNAKNMADEIIINLWTYNILAGLIISPFVISTFFVKSFAILLLVKIVIFSLIIFFFIKIIRWFEIFFSQRVSILYMILYLCTLEFMPLLVLYKVVS